MFENEKAGDFPELTGFLTTDSGRHFLVAFFI
jgi:hypothetical protein